MERNIRINGVVNLAALLSVAVCSFGVARYSDTLAGQVSVAFLLMGFYVALLSYFQMRLEENERLERLELNELARKSQDSALFQKEESELYPARRAREQFDKYFIPGFSIFLLVLQVGGVWWLWQWLAKAEVREFQSAPMAASLFGLLFFLTLFLLGKYSVGISRLENQRLLRPGAGYLLLGAYLCLATGIGIGVAAYTGFTKADIYIARAFVAILGLITVENLIGLTFEVYRPRVKGKETRLLYDSRLVGLLGQPEGLFTTAAQALDYQFGFKVSETWFYRFLQQYLGLFVVVQAAVLLLSTCFVFIEPGEQALLERFGSPVQGRLVLESGMHLKYPWPIDKVYRHQTQQIQTLKVGYVAEEKEEQEKVVLWNVMHFKEEFNLLVANRERFTTTAGNPDDNQAVPVNLLAANIPVQFQVTNLQAWITRYADAGKLLEKIATREVVHYLASVDINEIMTRSRAQAAEDLRNQIQAQADEKGLGARIIFVGLQGIHPPTAIADAYQSVQSAAQAKEAKILEAQGYAARTVPLAKAEAAKRVMEAEAYRARTTANAVAQAAKFKQQMAAYDASPEVFSQRSYLAALTRGGNSARKYVLGTTNTDEVILFNLEDKYQRDLLDLQLPPSKTK